MGRLPHHEELQAMGLATEKSACPECGKDLSDPKHCPECHVGLSEHTHKVGCSRGGGKGLRLPAAGGGK